MRIDLPTIQPDLIPGRPLRPVTRKSNLVDTLWHAVRVALLIALVVGLHRWSARQASQRSVPIDNAQLLSEVQRELPLAVGLESLGNSSMLQIVDATGKTMGALVTTSPAADGVVGYSGPNNILVVLAPDQSIVATRLLSSGDTRDHVALVQRDAAFWQQFVGRQWGASQSAQLAVVDGVSGATLTSLAIAEAIALRMSGQRLSLRFPQPLSLAEAQSLCAEATELVEVTWQGQAAWQPRDAGGASLGTIVRTGSFVDAIEGYQGPSELLLWFDSADDLKNLKLRTSYDNEPYVGYVRQEYSFWPIFKNRDLQSLASIDLQAEKIEGVSGATMTSIAVAHTLQATAEQLLQASSPDAGPDDLPPGRQWNWSSTEIATALLALCSIPWSRWRARGKKIPRLLWQVACLIVLGIAAGNLLSLALFAGWTRGGIPIHLAPGLVTLLTVALVWPVVSKSNVYCDQLCPHGILQQWLLPWRGGQRRARREGSANRLGSSGSSGFSRSGKRWWVGTLRLASYVGIAAAISWLVFDGAFSLAALEPFDAYAWRIGWSFSCLVWAASLGLAVWRPMSYCQLACPTGRVLHILRRSRRGKSSWLVELVLATAVAAIWLALSL